MNHKGIFGQNKKARSSIIMWLIFSIIFITGSPKQSDPMEIKKNLYLFATSNGKSSIYLSLSKILV